ncbi:MAG: type IV secretion system protein, partial [Aaplasma endosymbiont of Hyalomma asiaticum]
MILQKKIRRIDERKRMCGVIAIRCTSSRFLRLVVLLCLLMSSCGSEVPFPRCISADNFNKNSTIAVSAYYGPGNVEAFRAENGEVGNGTLRGATKQVVRWKDTGLLTNGEHIVVKTQGAWVPWDKDGKKTSSQIAVNTGVTRPLDPADEFYDAVVDVDRVCGPYVEGSRQVNGCTVDTYSIPDKDDLESSTYGRPCWLDNGYGAYLLFKKPEDEDPNATLDIMEFPQSATAHLGHSGTGEGGRDKYSTEENKWGIYNSSCDRIDKPERGWKIYVKILDNYYYDNAGGYSLEFLSGVMSAENSDIFEYVRKLVRDELDKAGQTIFKGITGNNAFKSFVFALITLSIVLTSLVYILGMVRTPFTDLIAKLLKIVLVLLLISPNSWTFFYDHLLQLFLKGVDEIIALVNSHTIGGNFRADAPFGFMDIMIRDKIFSPIVWEAKARALITADWSSIFALFLIIISVLFYIGLCMYGFVMYLTAFVGITFLVSLMPIMFVGILFSRFKSLFDGWLTQCISFSMQAILMFTLIALFGELIMHYYYRIFGFTACYNEWIHLKIPLIVDKKYYEWTPGQKYDSIKIGWRGAEKRGYPEAGSVARYTFTGGGSIIAIPPDYKEMDFRYVDYPFLDPDIKSSTVPGGVDLNYEKEEAKKLQQIANLTNYFIATESPTAIGRLVSKIEKELDIMKTKGDTVVSYGEIANFKDLVKKQREKKTSDGKVQWTDSVFRDKVKKILIGKVLLNNTVKGTSVEELEKQYDYNIIKNIKQGWIVMWSEVFGLMLVTFLIWQMRAFVHSIAVVLSGGGMMSRTVASMYDEGFLKIFSGIPVIGRAFETVDRGIDGLRMVARAKLGDIASGVASVPEKALGRVPIVGGAMSSLIAGTRHVIGGLTATNTEEAIYTMKSISPKFDYARAWIGAHLGYSPLDALKYVGSYSLAKMTGSTSGGLMDNIRQDRAALLQNIRTLTIGVDKHKPSVYIPGKKDPSDGSNPFRRPDGTLTRQKRPDEDLFDNDGNLHIHKGNFWNAVDTMHAFNVMERQADDDVAKEKINGDVDRLKGEISQFIRNHPDEIPELNKFVSPSGEVDFAMLQARALERRGALEEGKTVEDLRREGVHSSIGDHASIVREASETSRVILDEQGAHESTARTADEEIRRSELDSGMALQGILGRKENDSADMQSEYLRAGEEESVARDEGVEQVSSGADDADVSNVVTRDVPEDIESFLDSTSGGKDSIEFDMASKKDEFHGLPGDGDVDAGVADAEVLQGEDEKKDLPHDEYSGLSQTAEKDQEGLGYAVREGEPFEDLLDARGDSDFSDTFTEMFDEEKAAARAAE